MSKGFCPVTSLQNIQVLRPVRDLMLDVCVCVWGGGGGERERGVGRVVMSTLHNACMSSMLCVFYLQYLPAWYS